MGLVWPFAKGRSEVTRFFERKGHVIFSVIIFHIVSRSKVKVFACKDAECQATYDNISNSHI